MKKVQNLIVGCGLSGIVLAERLAEDKNESVLIVDKRAHVGGNIYDYKDKNGKEPVAEYIAELAQKNDKRQPVIVLGPLHTFVNPGVEFRIKPRPVSEDDEADAVSKHRRQFIQHGFRHKVHQIGDLAFGPVPVFFRKGIQ